MKLLRKYKVVLDTNVFISAIFFGGNPLKLLKLWQRDVFTLCLSPELEEEIIRKLIFKFKAPEQLVKNIHFLLKEKGEKYLPKKRVVFLKDNKDNFLFELVEEAEADFLVTGDKKLLSYQRYKKTLIVAPKGFLRWINFNRLK